MRPSQRWFFRSGILELEESLLPAERKSLWLFAMSGAEPKKIFLQHVTIDGVRRAITISPEQAEKIRNGKLFNDFDYILG